MTKKIIISEKQLKSITNHLNENEVNRRVKNSIYDFLMNDYIPSSGVKKISNEFFNTPLVKKRIDGTMITPKELCDYIKHRFSNVNEDVVLEVIKGWFFDDYDKEIGMRKS